MTFIEISVQMLKALKELHESNLVHRDVKPDSFMIQEDCVKIIGFGLATQYTRNGEHIKQSNYGFFSSQAFASISCLEGNNGVRKDDIESLGYSIMYLIDS